VQRRTIYYTCQPFPGCLVSVPTCTFLMRRAKWSLRKEEVLDALAVVMLNVLYFEVNRSHEVTPASSNAWFSHSDRVEREDKYETSVGERDH